MRPFDRKTGTVALVAALLILTPIAAGAAGRVAAATSSGAAVVWQPQVAAYDHLELTVAGPGGVVTREFRPGDAPSFSLFDAAGDAVADGAYRWELRVVPKIDAATREALARDRESGSTATADRLRATGALPAVSTESGYFSVVDGALVMPGDFDEPAAATGGITAEAAGAMTPLPANTVLTNADGVIRNSLCVGFDCPNSPSFSDTTVLLMENNTRIKFDDTSSIAGFPNRDWELEANSSASGGPNQFAINDCASSSQGGCATDSLFVITGNAPANSLFVDSGGRIGRRTSTPSVELHIVDGDSPAIRLDQDGSSGFAPQRWDIAGNETSFFVRDVTNGSQLPLRIRPDAPSSSIDIAADGDVGMGTSSPDAPLHVVRTGASGLMMHLVGNGDVFFRQENSTTGQFVDVNLIGDEFRINFGTGGAGPELRLTSTGDLIITGGYTPDYVFEPDYKLMPIAELADFVSRERHLPNVPNAAEIKTQGLNVNNFPMRLLEKIEELTLYTVDQHEQIADQQAQIADQKAQIEAQTEGLTALNEQNARLQARLEALERLVAVATSQE